MPRQGNSAVLVDAIHFFRTENSFADLNGASLRYMQLCDARPERPRTCRRSSARRAPIACFRAKGGLDLKGLLGALPAGIPISLEISSAEKDRALGACEAGARSDERYTECRGGSMIFDLRIYTLHKQQVRAWLKLYEEHGHPTQ